MAGIKIESKRLPSINCLQGTLRGYYIESNFGRVDLQGKLDTILVKHVEYGVPHLRKVFKAFFNLSLTYGGNE